MLKSKRVLLLGTYPIKSPQHGGQKRAAAIVEAYEKVFDAVQYVAVFNKRNYHEYTRWDVPLSRSMSIKADQNPLTGDIVCGRAIYEDNEVRHAVEQKIRRFKPDVIHIEQPYIYIGLRQLLSKMGISPKIIFSSQNVEGPMKREILTNAGLPTEYVEEAVKTIDSIERSLCQVSSLVAACTQADAGVHKKQGAKKVVLAMNGIAPIRSSKRDKQYWQKKLERSGVKRTALFVASAHPPSITGFGDMIGKGVGFLGQDERILVAGGISDHYVNTFKAENIDIGDATFWLRVMACGRLSENKLQGLLTTADVILLPITEGGGSNLKTAEAVASNSKIVATSHALRSFEWLKDFPNVWVADTPAGFKEAILQALRAPKITRSREQERQAKTVLWEHRLNDLLEEVSKI